MVLSLQSSMDQDLSIPFEIQVWIAPACFSIEQYFQMLQFDFTMLLARLGIKLNPHASSRESCHRGRVKNQRVSTKMILYHWLAECQRIEVWYTEKWESQKKLLPILSLVPILWQRWKHETGGEKKSCCICIVSLSPTYISITKCFSSAVYIILNKLHS